MGWSMAAEDCEGERAPVWHRHIPQGAPRWGVLSVTATGLAAFWWVESDLGGSWRMAGDLGLVGAIFGSMWVWLRKHREALAEAVQREAAVCQAAAPRPESRRPFPENGRPTSNRLWYEPDSMRWMYPSKRSAARERCPMDRRSQRHG